MNPPSSLCCGLDSKGQVAGSSIAAIEETGR